MKRYLLILIIAVGGARADALAASCTSYYITEINLVSVAETEAGNVHTFVGFGQTKQEAERNAVSACSHVRFDAATCVDSDRISGRNVASDAADNSLHVKYMNAVRRITGCS